MVSPASATAATADLGIGRRTIAAAASPEATRRAASAASFV